MRNLSRITNYCNRQEAWKDWNRIVAAADHFYGAHNLVETLKPPDNAGWKTIDRAIAKLRAELCIDKDCPDCEGYGVMHLTNGKDVTCDCTWKED